MKYCSSTTSQKNKKKRKRSVWQNLGWGGQIVVQKAPTHDMTRHDFDKILRLIQDDIIKTNSKHNTRCKNTVFGYG